MFKSVIKNMAYHLSIPHFQEPPSQKARSILDTHITNALFFSPFPITTTDGNPVTGEGYSKSNGAAEINTTVPSLNGGGHVINKNRIPPGGFSSGLW